MSWLRHIYRSCSHGKQVRVRFAPSPTGQLHLGGLRTALYNYLFARSHGGKFILRIEDTDQARLVAGAQRKLSEMLHWCQIEVDEGPDTPDTHTTQYGPYIQSHRLPLYTEMIKVLLENGTAYRCFCSERRLKLLHQEALQRRETPKYDNNCRHMTPPQIEDKLAENRPHTVRFKLSHYTEPWTDLVYGDIVYDVASIEGDPILMKSDGYPTYHFANVVDDHHMDISHVLRGLEWQVSTTKHILLYKAFNWTPPQYGHLPLLLNKDGKKLSKRQGDVFVEDYKDKGYYPETILNLLTDTGSGFKVRSTAGMNMHELIDNFDLKLLNTRSTRLDFEKLDHFNRHKLQRQLENDDEVTVLAHQFIAQFVEKFSKQLSSSDISTPDLDYVIHVLQHMKSRIHKLDDLLATNNLYLWFPTLPGHLSAHQDPQQAIQVIKHGIEMLEGMKWMDEGDLKVILKDMCTRHDLEFSATMKLLRTGLSTLKHGPGIAEMISTLGRDNSLVRLRNTLQYLTDDR